NVAEGSDTVIINDKPKHILSYLNDFLFTPQRARTPVKALSGGERARLLLAKLFTQPANLLVLDEPTNDLDMETLELLEEVLLDFEGTVLIVSHDRAFLDNVVTSTLVFDGTAKVHEFVGGFDDWIRQGGKLKLLGMTESVATENSINGKTDPAQATDKSAETKLHQGQNAGIVTAKKKLSYKLQRELDAIPAKIDALEQELAQLQQQTSDPEFYMQSTDKTEPALQRMLDVEQLLEELLERWAELEDE
ncbi:MAG: ATP-binding cassette domain-containing protein, partial [Gammaproteobacteria bacterium]|nr:ATP-binding cassette domain-containing protein [Gammaproteobacteria bacterium]